ncbi:hypothetical protein NDU88_002600 [Pleurodeles waltl]|uniref:Uncharacterized protein n=1 Tax=Pleurodeles waltl TaxID=8319 RepID=A0AAV7W138_PLEWA|nr:hypothetical protein NDU88_002600 [Pleurodeles waltl]
MHCPARHSSWGQYRAGGETGRANRDNRKAERPEKIAAGEEHVRRGCTHSGTLPPGAVPLCSVLRTMLFSHRAG